MTNITVSLETARKLKEAGREKECSFYYQLWELRYYTRWQTVQLYDDTFVAPTAQEILDEFEQVKERVIIKWLYPSWGALFVEEADDFIDVIAKGIWDTVTEALADLWVECKEQWYLDTLPKE